jgi:hypothetical protein
MGWVLVTGTRVSDRLLAPVKIAGLEIDTATHLLAEAVRKERLRGAVAYLLGEAEQATRSATSSSAPSSTSAAPELAVRW